MKRIAGTWILAGACARAMAPAHGGEGQGNPQRPSASDGPYERALAAIRAALAARGVRSSAKARGVSRERPMDVWG
ncbi:hypothetical protein [Microvirga guangxiensis]|uniref:hypothetical protein n=1 Tax=Microvirga guangxiensis TaxID=549386 RepID=UPI0011140344|nr:hypothetical protein [Microvirga guangxiensis]